MGGGGDFEKPPELYCMYLHCLLNTIKIEIVRKNFEHKFFQMVLNETKIGQK